MDPIRLNVDEETEAVLREINEGIENTLRDVPKLEELRTELADAHQKSDKAAREMLQSFLDRRDEILEKTLAELPRWNQLREELASARTVAEELAKQVMAALQSSQNETSQQSVENAQKLEQMAKDLVLAFERRDDLVRQTLDAVDLVHKQFEGYKIGEWFSYLDANLKRQQELLQPISVLALKAEESHNAILAVVEQIKTIEAQLARVNRPWWRKLAG